jgi:hypothetical protein
LCLDPWQEQLRLPNIPIRYLAFDHGILLDQRFEWQQLIDAGNQLQSDLVTLCDADEVSIPVGIYLVQLTDWNEQADRRPLVLISHSLGGLVLKQVLFDIIWRFATCANCRRL